MAHTQAMDNQDRPNPDALLAQIQSEEQARTRGRLKIFLGYAAGVGKTYAMLEAAHQRMAEGVDVVVGYIETHRRLETEAMLADLQVLPRKAVEYHGVTLTEMDVTAVLARSPQLVLVDELAHSNAPGSLHSKRYQDVEDLLVAGIDVYTTLNVQHLESLNDVIAQITGVTVRETVPDSVIDVAAEIELIDLPPEELLRRLRDGKVYVPEQAARALEKFFRKGNLTALRELTMRRAAERVDDQMRAYMQTRAIPGPWPAAERLLVCVSPSPLAERLVRAARRLADELNAEWQAIYVETPDQVRLDAGLRDQVARTLQLAEDLGAYTTTLTGQSVAASVLQYAREHNVTKIIAGKPLRPRWRELLSGSVVDQLIHASGTIDIYVISGQTEPITLTDSVKKHRFTPGTRYAGSLLLVTSATALSALFQPYISPTNLVMIYLLAVLLSAIYLGRGPSLLTSFLSVLAFDFFFVPPFLTFVVDDTEYLLTFTGLLAVGLVISQLTARVRDQAEAARRREADTAALYSLSRELAAVDTLGGILNAIVSSIGQTFSRQVAIYLPEGQSEGPLRLFNPSVELEPDENEEALAGWVYEHGQPAGRGTDTLPAAQARYLPLKTAKSVVGVLGVRPKDPASVLGPEQRRLLEAFASQSALAIERAQLAEQARQAQLLQATEKLQTALLNSISHDLRTPLVSITGVLSSLKEGGPGLQGSLQASLVDTALEEADRLNRLVGNLLDMTRLESGALSLAREPADIQDVIGAALDQLGSRLGNCPVSVHIESDLPLVPIDFVLIVHVLVNIIDNAMKYSPDDAPIEILARLKEQIVEIEIYDRGLGIPQEDLERVFEKFYRVHRPESITGTGLGLSISKGIVEAHGGKIWAHNRPGGGSILTLALPVEGTPRHD